jgi:hypothetical protein
VFNLLPGSGSIDYTPELIQTKHRLVFPLVQVAKAPHQPSLRKANFLSFIPIPAKEKEYLQGAATHFENLAKQRFLHLVGRKPRFVGLSYKVDHFSGFIQPFPAVESVPLFIHALLHAGLLSFLSGELSLNILSKRSPVVYLLLIIGPFLPKQWLRKTGCTH